MSFQKKIKRRKDYSNTKDKTRNLLMNVSYRRFKQSDFNKDSFIVDILSFLLQNFNPINLERKLEMEKERDMVKFMLDECIPHEFVRFMYKHKYYNQISQTNLTYQKANTIVKEYLFEDMNRINQLKYKIEEKFSLIHYVYSTMFTKIYNRTNNFGIQKKNNFDFYFSTWKNRKTTGPIGQKILKQLPAAQTNQITAEVLSTAKNPANYYDRDIEKNEQVPIDIKITDDIKMINERPTMVSVNNAVDENANKKRVEKRKMLEKQLSENTLRMKQIKKANKL